MTFRSSPVRAASFIAMVVLLFAMPTLGAPSKPKPKPKPSPSASPPARSPTDEALIRVEKFYRETLPNGMKVVVVENHRNPVTSVNIVVRVGSMYETEHLNGISHFCEHLFFRGTPRRTGEQFKREIEALGGFFNAETTKDYTHFYINLPSEYTRQGLDLFADALENATMNPSEVNVERKAVIDELRMDLENPGAMIDTGIYELAFQRHPYRMAVIGTEKNVQDATIEELRAYKRRFYTPKRTTLVVVGDVNATELMPTIRELFAPFTGNNDQPDDIPQEPTHPDGVREKVVRQNLSSAYVVMGFKAPSVRDRPDIYQVDTLTFLMGQGDGSLLSQQLVDEKKLSIDASAEFTTQRDPGLIELVSTCQPNHIEKVKQAMLDVITQVQNGKFTQADFDRAKALLINTYQFGNETDSGQADGLCFYAAIDDVGFAQTYLDGVRKVTMADVAAAAKKYLTLRDYSVFVLRPGDQHAQREENQAVGAARAASASALKRTEGIR